MCVEVNNYKHLKHVQYVILQGQLTNLTVLFELISDMP